MRKAALHNLGCKVNSYETEAMQQLLEAAGYEIVPFEEKADVYIVNTCSVTNVADKKSRQMLHRAKKQNPGAVVAAAGCYVQAAGDRLKKDLAVDLLIGNNKKAELVSILEEAFRGREALNSVIDIASSQDYEPLRIGRVADHTRAFIKVQDGCNQFCSYCIIPYTRGRVRSRRPEDVEQEVKELAKNGYKEIVLTGIHLSSYGLDFDKNEKPSGGNGASGQRDFLSDRENEDAGGPLLDLIERLHEIDGVERIRLGSLEPRVITVKTAGRLAALPKLCPHFHLSLQSGCDATLKRMNRHYTCGEYEERCRILRACFSNPAITTDVIAGFPGETEEEFEETREFLKRIGFYEIHVFKYSRRAGTRADRMPEQVPEQIKTERSAALLELEQAMSKAYRRTFLGKESEILLEEPVEIAGSLYMLGHTKEYVKAAVPVGGRDVKVLKNRIVFGILKEFLTDEIIFLAEIEKLG